MDRRTLLDALNRSNTFLMSYRLIGESGPRYVSMKVSRMRDDENYIIIGVTDDDERMKQRRAAARMKEEHIAYARINALAGDILCVYVVVPETGRYREYSATTGYESLALPKEGMDFFTTSRRKIRDIIYPEDLDRFLSLFTKDGVEEEIARRGIFALSYRLVINEKPVYVQLKAAMVDEPEGRRKAIDSGGIVIACGIAKYDNDACVAAVFERADRDMYENKSSLKTARKG